MRYSSLSNIRVLDLTHRVAGPYATKLLADVGAEVIKVEPPWGEGGRRIGPVRPGSPADNDRGGLFAFLNTNKLGVTINLKHARGAELLARMLEGADLMVENFAPGTMARFGLSPQALLERFPRLSIVSISNFGQDGPDRGAPLNDLTLFARGGWTYPVGEPDREPLTPPGSLGQFMGAMYAAIASLQAILARDMTVGRGQHVDISLLESVLATMIYEPVGFQYTGVIRERTGKRFAIGPFMIVTLKCRDGYAGLHCVNERQWEGLCDLMDRRDLLGEERFKNPLARMQNNDAWLAIVEPFFLEHERDWLYREGQKRAIPLVPIPSVAELLEWEQLKARDYFETINDPVLGPIRVPGAPLRLGSSRPEPSRPAPTLGQHNREVFSRFGLDEGEITHLHALGAI